MSNKKAAALRAIHEQSKEVSKEESAPMDTTSAPVDIPQKRTSLANAQPRNLNTLWDDVKNNAEFSSLDPVVKAYLEKRVELKDNFMSSRNYNRCLRDVYAALNSVDAQDKQHALESAKAIAAGKARKPREATRGLDADGKPIAVKKRTSKKDVKKSEEEEGAAMSTSEGEELRI